MSGFDPTMMLREGTRLGETRYQVEILFRNRLSDEFTQTDDKVRQIADWAIRTACLFEEYWMIASMRADDMQTDSSDDALIWEIMKIQEPI